MPYDRQIPDAPIPVSMFPRATTLTKNDLLYLVQPGNNPGEKSKSLTLETLFASDVAKFGIPEIRSNILEFTGAISQVDYTEIAHLDIDPRFDVDFRVWGTSNTATESAAGNRYEYGFQAKVHQMYLPDDQDRDLVMTYSCGFQTSVDEAVAGTSLPTYNVVFPCLPFNYNPSKGKLASYPTKRVTLYLMSGSDRSPYQAKAPSSYTLKIQARVYPAKLVTDLLKAPTP